MSSSPLAKFYHWLWHDVCGCKQPWTFTVRDWQKANPLAFLLIVFIIGLCVGVKCKSYKAIGIVVGIVLVGILAGHLWW